MFRFLTLFCCAACLFLIPRLLRGTYLEISWQKKSFAGLLLAKEIFLLILPGIALYSFDVYRKYTYFYVTDESVREATVYALYALLMFVVTLAFISKVIFARTFLATQAAPVLSPRDSTLIAQLCCIALSLILIVSAAFVMMGMKHAFLFSIISGNDLIETRLQNRYATAIPTVVMSFYRFLFVTGAILLGLSWAQSAFAKKIVGTMVLVFAASFLGDKAPVFSVLLLIILARLSVKSNIPTRKIFQYSLMMVLISIGVLYAVTYIQFGDVDFQGFYDFLIARAGMGQIGGLYEQFALKLSNVAYIWHSVPFANFFLDYPVYNKDLMMMLWGANGTEIETGVANSLFVGEAYAIGGYSFALLSPIVVAVNYCAAILCLTSLFRRLFGISPAGARLILQLLIPSIFVLTGDIAGVLFGKLLIMTMIFVAVLWMARGVLYRSAPLRYA